MTPVLSATPTPRYPVTPTPILTPTPSVTPTPIPGDLLNPGFEESQELVHWNRLGAGDQITWSAETAGEGNYSCKFAAPTLEYTDRGIRSDPIGVFAGRRYDISGYFYVKEAGGEIGDTTISFGVEWRDEFQEIIGTYPADASFANSAFGGWEKKNYKWVEAPAGTVYASLLIECREDIDNDNDIYIDDFSITESGPTPTVTPSVTPTPSITPTPTVSPTITPTSTPSPPTETPPPTPRHSTTPTPVLTPTPRYTVTPMATATPTATPSVAPSITPTPVITPTPTIIKCFQVAGRVIDKDTGAVLSAAAVRIVCPDKRSGVGNANGAGEYDLPICTHFPDGSVRAQARRQGYLPGYADASYIDWADEGVVEMGDIELKTDSIYSGGIVSGDYDGDGMSDIAIFRPVSGLWAIRGISRLYFGGEGDELIPADYDGDGTADVSIFRAASGLWAIRGWSRIYYGDFNDIPVPGDYAGSGTANIGIFRGASGLWAIRSVTRAYFGGRYDQPMPGDYDGDGSWDTSIFRSSSGLWAMRGISRFYFGASDDRLVPGDYDGLGYRAAGIFRGSSGLWAIKGVTRVYYGKSGDQPVPRYHEDMGKDTIGIFRAGSGLWAVKDLTRAYYGSSGDIPVTR